MSILYTQIHSLDHMDLILSSYSRHGKSIYSDTLLLRELRSFIDNIPLSEAENTLVEKESNGKIFFAYSNGVKLFSCITDDSTSSGIVTAYLGKVENLETEDEVKEYMDKFNNEYTKEEISEEVTKARDICVMSLEKIMNRGEKISKLNNLADELSHKVKTFQRESEKVFSEENTKYIVMGVLAAILLLFLFYLFK